MIAALVVMALVAVGLITWRVTAGPRGGSAARTGTAPSGSASGSASSPTGAASGSGAAGASGDPRMPASVSTPADPDPDVPRPGATGLGDRLYPALGNGGYQVDHYDLDLRYPTASATAPLTGTVTATAVAGRALSSFSLDFAGTAVGSVTVDGAPATFRRDGEELVVTPAQPLTRGARFVVTVRDFASVAPSADPGKFEIGLLGATDGTVWMGQPANSHQVFPSNDHPGDKATFSFRIDVPAGITAVANGEPEGSPTTAKGRTVWRYIQPEPMATELAQVAVGRFTVTRRAASGGLLVRDVTPTRLTSTLAPLLADEVKQVDWLRAKVGEYPFKAVGSLVADATFAFGGLESQTLILYPLTVINTPSPELRRQVMVHELAHQWFGDSVSPAGWSDVWLNEGHATWYEYLWNAEQQAGAPGASADQLFDLQLRDAYGRAGEWRKRSGPVAVPTGAATTSLFAPNVYGGGALVLYALRQTIGTAAFDRLERSWVSTYRGRSASTQDFVALAAQVSGRDLSGFARDWLYGTTLPPMPGHPDWAAESSSPS